MSLADRLARMLQHTYRALGAQVLHTPAAGGPARPVRMVFDVDGSAGVDGMLQSIGPSLRGHAADFPDGIARDDLFAPAAAEPQALGGRTWRAREAALPLNDGQELLVPLARA